MQKLIRIHGLDTRCEQGMRLEISNDKRMRRIFRCFDARVHANLKALNPRSKRVGKYHAYISRSFPPVDFSPREGEPI